MTTPQKEKISRGARLLGLAVALILAFVILLAPETQAPEPGDERRYPPLAENPYTPTDFAYAGDYLTCTGGRSVLGIDVSEFQQDVDWEAVKAAGVEYAIIRVGWRGSESGRVNADQLAQAHYDGARAAGLQIGVYFFSQAITPEEAVEEAEFTLDAIRNWELELPVVFDWEYVSAEARTAQMDADGLTAITLAFCQRVAQAGQEPMLYFNYYQGRDLLHLEQLQDYRFWLALHDSPMDYPHQVDFWQYTATGQVPGIAGNVDLNLMFVYD